MAAVWSLPRHDGARRQEEWEDSPYGYHPERPLQVGGTGTTLRSRRRPDPKWFTVSDAGRPPSGKQDLSSPRRLHRFKAHAWSVAKMSSQHDRLPPLSQGPRQWPKPARNCLLSLAAGPILALWRG